MYTDDPVRDAMDRLRKQEEWESNLPRCSFCGNPIQEERYYVINDENVCQECLDNEFMVENEAL